ncbi:PorP/SprF family type IX secretion system membrane protein [Arenibacter certesii]|uniref:Type IX secretion system membrane protein PorP/SprF n=1 Tax=Arenibacter certesii TaxID=228955 RepID=A0A918MP49_9FLAO|nr:PorP/SprF family type IX secretion system membrane protein [Arenibacter certesii]GGW43508.1 hypothetical protein GCM10007383_30040 [Arenibacter certesii]
MYKKNFLYILFFILAFSSLSAQDDSPFISYDVPSQNLLKFNRFLINPTFSTVRENKSYINLLHRNQSVSFDDNNQDYFLSYSGRVSDRNGVGLSLYTQREGLITNYGVMANYAYGVKLSDKSNFTFGANLAYYNSGFDRNRASALDPNDPSLNGLQESNLLSFQPGFNISFGKFDVGVFAENLFDYNLKTSKSVSEFQDKTFSSHLQYTHEFENEKGIFENGRLMPLARVRKVGEEEVVLGGSLIVDLPKLGWIQAGYDDFYGASAGIGFNLNERLSLGYTMEKGLSNNFDNFGLTHEISFAYSITPTLTEDRVMLQEDYEQLVEKEVETEDNLIKQKDELEELRKSLAENNEILAELMFRQDSLEANRQRDLERRFDMVMKMVRNETQGKRPDIEEKAKNMYLPNNVQGALALQANNKKNTNKPIGIKEALQSKDANGKVANNNRLNKNTENNAVVKDQFTEMAKRQNIKSKKFTNLEGVDKGYYVVANVYKGDRYMNQFIDKLADEGIKADHFKNNRNGLKYVYLERYDTWQEALAAHKTKFNGSYQEDLWIMNVDNQSDNDKAYVNNVNKLKGTSSQYEVDKLQKNVVVKDNVGGEATATSTPKEYKKRGSNDYYIIANVFANAHNANSFVKLLNAQGYSAGYFINPKNNYRYVYLKKYDSWNNALVSYYSKINNSYNDKIWIMKVAPNQIT